MSGPPAAKKPKPEVIWVDNEGEEENKDGGRAEGGEEEEDNDPRQVQEEALLALVEHRAKEVEHLRRRVSYYKSQFDEAERRLHDSESKLARLRRQDNVKPSKNLLDNGAKNIKMERRSASPINSSKRSPKEQLQQRPELLIPAMRPKISQPIKPPEKYTRTSDGSGAQAGALALPPSPSVGKVKEESSCSVSSKKEASKIQDKEKKRKFEHKEHTELIPLVRKSTSASIVRCHTSSHIPSQHKRKLRSLSLCPVNDQLFVTSALDGVVNLWQIQARGSGASLLSSTDCPSLKQRRWPEDVAWHPNGNSLFCVYSADGGDSQISVIDLNKTQGKGRVTFLEHKPHVKGIINSINFPPWEDTCFVSGGSDHAVIYWTDRDEDSAWKPKALHRNFHTSAVMGVAGLQEKQIVMSVGADKRIIGFDLLAGRVSFKHYIESKCMSVLPNPCDFNLFMVQTGTHEAQLRLFDIRSRHAEIHSFGWKQESSESQSALINQAWSPDGLYLTSGSADPVIHIFDIRFNAHKPSQSIKAHQKRVFKAVWHYSHPLIISISSDLNIGLHKVT